MQSSEIFMKFRICLILTFNLVLLITVFPVQMIYGVTPKNCLEWFKKTGLDPGAKTCVTKCQTSRVDLGTFECTKYCKELCKNGKRKDEISCEEITDPGLWTKFWKFPKWPWNIRKAQDMGTEARRKMREFFPNYKKNGKTCSSWNRGAGDAFRHCYWNCEMTKEFGSSKALDYSDTQEFMYPNKCDEAKMDHANNRDLPPKNRTGFWGEGH
jgi:hypothetical protein